MARGLILTEIHWIQPLLGCFVGTETPNPALLGLPAHDLRFWSVLGGFEPQIRRFGTTDAIYADFRWNKHKSRRNRDFNAGHHVVIFIENSET